MKTDMETQRVVAYLGQAQVEAIEKLSEQTGQSISELIREAITSYLLAWKQESAS